jgi:hypothetical protein
MTDSFASGHRQHDWLATPRLHPSRVIFLFLIKVPA